MFNSDSVKTYLTSIVATCVSWICYHASEIQAVIIFLFTVCYLYWEIREAKANAIRVEKDLNDFSNKG